MKLWNLVLLALVALAAVGCNKTEEASTSTPPTSNPSGKPMASDMGAVVNAVASIDFSSPEKINETVIPALKKALAEHPKLKDAKLDVHLMDNKVIHVKGDVANNDMKRAIDEAFAPMKEQAKAAGINFLNGAIVKG